MKDKACTIITISGVIFIFLISFMSKSNIINQPIWDYQNYNLIQEQVDTCYETYISEYIPYFYSFREGGSKYKWTKCVVLKDSINATDKVLVNTRIRVLELYRDILEQRGIDVYDVRLQLQYYDRLKKRLNR